MYRWGMKKFRDFFQPTSLRDAFLKKWILPRPKQQSTGLLLTLTSFGPVFRIPTLIKNPATTNVVTGFLVGVSGFEPEASWTRTKRDTKLRHTPIAKIL